MSAEQKKGVLRLKKTSEWNVSCMDFRSRVTIKLVISGVAQEVKAEDITEDIDGVVGAHRLTCMVDGEKKFTSLMLLFLDEESLSSHIKLGFM